MSCSWIAPVTAGDDEDEPVFRFAAEHAEGTLHLTIGLHTDKTAPPSLQVTPAGIEISPAEATAPGDWRYCLTIPAALPEAAHADDQLDFRVTADDPSVPPVG